MMMMIIIIIIIIIIITIIIINFVSEPYMDCFATICFILNLPLLLLLLPRIGFFYMFCFGMSLLDEELISNSRRNSATDRDRLRHQMEMLSFSIARTNSVINKQTGKMTRRRMNICLMRLKRLLAFIWSDGNVVFFHRSHKFSD